MSDGVFVFVLEEQGDSPRVTVALAGAGARALVVAFVDRDPG